MNRIIAVSLLSIFMFYSSVNYAAKGVYQTEKDFISQAFAGATPQVKKLWLTKEDKAVIADILQHSYSRMRVNYWQLGNETVWILDEIGKEKPITIGVHIKAQKISQLKVLTFRESRGDEVRHDFYAQQFINSQLQDSTQLSQHVDGITGATLSVRATTKIARLALWLDAKVINDKL